MSESFPELAQAVLENAQPDRFDIVRAKRHLLGQLGGGQPCASGTLITSIAALLGAGQLGHPQINLPSRDSVKAVVTADHPVTAAIRADLAAREALAELAADGMLIAAGQGLSQAATRSCSPSSCPGTLRASACDCTGLR